MLCDRKPIPQNASISVEPNTKRIRNERENSYWYCSSGRRPGDCCSVVIITWKSRIGQIPHSCHTVLMFHECYVEENAQSSTDDELLNTKHTLVYNTSNYYVEPIESGNESSPYGNLPSQPPCISYFLFCSLILGSHDYCCYDTERVQLLYEQPGICYVRFFGSRSPVYSCFCAKEPEIHSTLWCSLLV